MSISIPKDKTHSFYIWILSNLKKIEGKVWSLSGLWLVIGLSLVLAGNH